MKFLSPHKHFSGSNPHYIRGQCHYIDVGNENSTKKTSSVTFSFPAEGGILDKSFDDTLQENFRSATVGNGVKGLTYRSGIQILNL